jgi:hypothetical protein
MSEVDNLPLSGRTPGSYEVWFLTFTDPRSGTGYWIRSTLLHPRSGPGSAGVWFARFDPGDPAGTIGIHATYPDAKVSADEFDVRIGDSVMRSGHVGGSLGGGGHRIDWDLDYGIGNPTYRLLPDVMYTGTFAPTRPFSPNPQTLVSGAVTVDDERSEISAAPGQQGHLAGTRHAERWAWANCSDFIGEEAGVQTLTAQGRRGPLVTPYLTTVGVHWQGRWIRFTKLGGRDFGLGRWKVDVTNRRHRLTGRIEAPARALIRARYEDPDGAPRYCHNTETASSHLVLFERRSRGFEEVALLESRGTTHAEWAGRTPARMVQREFVEVAW